MKFLSHSRQTYDATGKITETEACFPISEDLKIIVKAIKNANDDTRGFMNLNVVSNLKT